MVDVRILIEELYHSEAINEDEEKALSLIINALQALCDARKTGTQAMRHEAYGPLVQSAFDLVSKKA